MNVTECDYDDLALDEACVILNNNDEHYNASLYSLSSDCILCPYTKISRIHRLRNTSLKLDTAKRVTWRVYNDSGIEDFRSAYDDSGVICQFQPNLGEYGIYELTLNDEGCDFDAIVEPSNPYIPLAIIIGTILCVLLGISFVRYCAILVRKKWTKAIANRSDDDATSTVRRILSIDTFRGISILTMIFVNNGSGGYNFLEHATWNGLLVGDLVFPSFVWIMGVCIPISLSSQLSRKIPRFTIGRRILKRSILLFLIGVSLNTLGTDANLKKIRIFGVLQRFGIAYLVVGLMYTFLSKRKPKKYESLFLVRIADFLDLWPQWIAIFLITAVHCVVTFCLPVPGCPSGYLGPGGRHDEGKYFNCSGGAAGYVDKIILGRNHMYDRPTIDRVYGSGPFDPEGILGCLTTILQTFLGVQTGKILRTYEGWKNRVLRWLLLALLCGCGGSALHFTNIIPINKNLWSLSFVLLTTSFALTLLTVCYLLVDVMSIWRGGPFRIPGTNALVMYIGHQMCYQIFPFHWQYGEMNSHMWQTIAALWDVGAWTIIAYALHRKRTYITL